MSSITVRAPVVISQSAAPPPALREKLLIGAKPIGPASAHVRSAQLRGHVLTLHVLHSGGSKRHDYQIAWDGKLSPRTVPGAVLHLSRDAKGDLARGTVQNVIDVDLRPLRDAYRARTGQKSGVVALSIAGTGRELTYRF